MLKDLIPKQRPPHPLYTTNIMTIELGWVVHGLVYSRYKEEGSDMWRAYRAESRKNLADLITQCRLLAEQCNWDYDELVIDGEETFRERMKEIGGWYEGKTGYEE